MADYCGIEVITATPMSSDFHITVRVPVPAPVSDAELLRRHLAGDQEAFGALFSKHFAIPLIGTWAWVGFGEDLFAVPAVVPGWYQKLQCGQA